MKERLLVCGSRSWNDYHLIYRELEHIHADRGIECVIHGGCRGADQIAGSAAVRMGIPVTIYGAMWRQHGKAAGPIRNQRMLDEAGPTLVLAFRDDAASSGTDDMVRRAENAGVPVKVVTPNKGEAP